MINKNFYPTPVGLIEKMTRGLDLKEIQTILEPSAGKGDIVEYIENKLNSYYYSTFNRNKYDIDCIEIDEDLRATLKGKGYRIVHNNFLSFNTMKHYDLIIMNPPFDNGDLHLLKALDLQQNGGAIICLLNAETIKNPYTNQRKELVQKLTDYNANIEYISDAFLNAERKTDVEVALIKVDIPKKDLDSIILNNLKQEETYEPIFDTSCKELTTFASQNEYIESAVEQYTMEVKLGVKLIHEYETLKPYIKKEIVPKGEKDYSDPILQLKVNDNKANVNDYVKMVRYKYWKALFNNDKFVGKLTSNLRTQLWNKLEELKNYDFSVWNIMTIQEEFMKETISGVEKTILDLFDELSIKYSYYDETSKNIHYYNGWKTNKAYKINKKVIVPYLRGNWEGKAKLTDIQKVFDYLDNGRTTDINVEETLKQYTYHWDVQSGVKIPLKYFTVTFYKKGTCHIEFTDLDLLNKFNLFGSQKKGWLPPHYGKKAYKDMTAEEKNIVKEFSGSESEYNKIYNKQDFYIVNTNNLLMIENN